VTQLSGTHHTAAVRLTMLQRLLNAAARLLSGSKTSDRGLSQVMHVDLHWLDISE